MLKTLEAFIAAVLVITAIAFPTQFLGESKTLEELNVKKSVFNALEILDNTGRLRDYALNNETEEIEEWIEKNANPFYNYKVVIYDYSTNITDANLPERENLLSVSYFLSGDYENFAIREIRVYLWK